MKLKEEDELCGSKISLKNTKYLGIGDKVVDLTIDEEVLKLSDT